MPEYINLPISVQKFPMNVGYLNTDGELLIRTSLANENEKKMLLKPVNMQKKKQERFPPDVAHIDFQNISFISSDTKGLPR